MLFYRLLLLCVLLSGAGGLLAQKSAPSVSLKTLEGKSVALQDYLGSGKITVLNFWATWCSPCKKELDAIAEVYADWQEKYGVQVLAITIDTQRDLPKVKPMVATKGWEYTVLSDGAGNLRNALNFQSIPQMYLLDQAGNIVYEHTGYLPGDELELEKKIAALAQGK